ncbi:MAG: hypothetical protein QNJ27_02950 [Simkaniaceae bacterium]|nr:hypothetical protein [Simkaniaceae bacterium]
MAQAFLESSDRQWFLIQELMNWTPPLEKGTPGSDGRKGLELDTVSSCFMVVDGKTSL